MSDNLILFVFEGAKKESQIVNSFNNYFLDSNRIVESAYCTTIYSLYRKIMKDEESTSLFGLLKENPKNKNLLSYKSKQFAEIYLFFDYDGHSNVANDEKLNEAINYFNEETDFGKLYISYPMVESLKHYSYDNDLFKNLKIECKEDVSYKKIVNVECEKTLIDFNNYNRDIWNTLIKVHLKKMNFIINGDFSLPKFKYSQDIIFEHQLEKYINADSTVSVLSSFPIFLFDFHNQDEIDNLFGG